SLISTSAAAPSLMPEEFAAVTVPSAMKAGFSFAIASRLASWRMCSSVSTETGPLRVSWVTGTISAAKRPARVAAEALCCEPSARHRIADGDVAEPLALPTARDMRGICHRLLPTGEDDRSAAGLDLLVGQHRGAEPGAADLVDQCGRGAVGQAGLPRRLPSG